MLLVRRKRKKPRIDMVPLIDLLMVLIIFFLVTMQFRDLRALNVKLPKIDSAGSNLITNELTVSITKEGEFFANNKTISVEKLTRLLEVTSTLNQKPVILVVADEEVPLKYVTQVVDLCRINGLEDFRLQAR